MTQSTELSSSERKSDFGSPSASHIVEECWKAPGYGSAPLTHPGKEAFARFCAFQEYSEQYESLDALCQSFGINKIECLADEAVLRRTETLSQWNTRWAIVSVQRQLPSIISKQSLRAEYGNTLAAKFCWTISQPEKQDSKGPSSMSLLEAIRSTENTSPIPSWRLQEKAEEEAKAKAGLED